MANCFDATKTEMPRSLKEWAAPVAAGPIEPVNDILSRVAAVAGETAARELVLASGGFERLFPSPATLAAGKCKWLARAVGQTAAEKIASLFERPERVSIPLPLPPRAKQKLPGVLADIEGVAGREVALEISRHTGGREMIFPSKQALEGGHSQWLPNLVGLENAQKIAALFPRSTVLYVSPAPTSFTRARREEVERRIALGQSARAIAVALHIHTPTVWNIRSQLRKAL